MTAQDPQEALREATDKADEARRERIREIEADRSSPDEDLLSEANINAAGPKDKTQTEIAAERRAAEMREKEATASARAREEFIAEDPKGTARGEEITPQATPDPSVPDPEPERRGTIYRVLRQIMVATPDDDGGDYAAWIEVSDVAAPNRDAAIKSVAMAMIENAMRDGASLTDAFAAVQGTMFAAPPASSFVATPANPTINLRVG